MSDVFYPAIERVRDICSSALAACDPAPYVSVGGSGVDHDFEVVVRELPESVGVSDLSTSRPVLGGRYAAAYHVEFDVAIQMWAKRSDVEAAARDVTSWWTLIAAAVASDRTLGGACEHAAPFLSLAGTATQNPLYVAAADCGVRVKACIDPIQTD